MPNAQLKEDTYDEQETEAVEVEVSPEKEDAGFDASNTSAAVEETEVVEEEKAQADEEELENYSKKVQKRINKLTERMREAERTREEAIHFAQQVQNENSGLKSKVAGLDEGYTNEYSNRVETQLTAAKASFKDAYDRGDADAMADAQRELSRLTIEEERLRINKSRKEENAPAPEAQQPQQPQQPQQFQQPQQQEQYQYNVPPPQPDPKAQSWAEKNDWFGMDERMTNAAFITHRELVENEGFDPSSDEYYEEVDKRMRRDFPHKFAESQTESNVGSTRPAQTVASASRKPKSGRRVVHLTKSQREIAQRLGVSIEDYAKYVKEN